jgi:sugar phosphate permease
VLGLLALAASSAYLTRHCLAVANTTMQEELHFNNEQFGYLYGAFSLGYLDRKSVV